MSAFHFCGAFKKSVGLAPHRYQVVRRMEKARSLRSDTDLNVTEIALRVGYDSSQALARAFRRDVGVAPSDYRKTLKS